MLSLFAEDVIKYSLTQVKEDSQIKLLMNLSSLKGEKQSASTSSTSGHRKSSSSSSSSSSSRCYSWVGLQPEKNKLVFFGKKAFFSAKKTQPEKPGQNFVSFLNIYFIHIILLPKLQKMANCAYITPRVWVTRQFSTGKKNLLVWKIKTRESKEN